MVCMICMVLYTLHGLNVLHDLHGLHDSPERRLPANHAQPKNHANHAFHFASPLRRARQKQGTATTRGKEFLSRVCGQKWVPPGACRKSDTLKKPPRFTPQGFRFARSRHLPIFTGRVQPTIFGTSELNFCVRNGNRWGLTVIDTGRPDLVYTFLCRLSRRLSYFVLEGRAFRTE